MSEGFFLTQPEFDSFTVHLKPGAGEPPEERTAPLLAELLPDGGEGWAAHQIRPDVPDTFDLLPPEEGSLSIKEAWDLTYALRLHPAVLAAEPVFDSLLDGVPDTDEAEYGDLPAELRASVLEEDEDEDPVDPAVPVAAGAVPAGPDTLDDDDPLWSPKLVQAPEAWQRTPRSGTGRARGAGTKIGHPDAGFRRHAELFSEQDRRVLLDRDKNFVERDRPDETEHEDGGHGLGTASVIMSLDNPPAGGRVVWGAAPAAEIVPYRVAKKRRLVPVPVLLSSGVRRLRDAIHAAVEERCHVISISLGWLWNRSLHEAVKRAFFDDIIVCAAAGNYVRFVVWPAHYPETIAVAGCTARRTKWKGSSRGRRVDVTAPAKRVWKATRRGAEETVKPSKGTSYSAATTAGLAALWLSHWGRSFLLGKYQGRFTLTTVFRRVLKATCDPPPPNDDGKFGAGIVNADRLLAAELPTLEELTASTAADAESAFAASSVGAAPGLRVFADVFEDAGPVALRRDLGDLLAVDEAALDGHLAVVGDELLFHLVTNPALRDSLLTARDAQPSVAGAVSGGLLATAETLPAPELRQSFLGLPDLSDRLRVVAE